MQRPSALQIETFKMQHLTRNIFRIIKNLCVATFCVWVQGEHSKAVSSILENVMFVI